jgi:hypothetical protein
MESPDKKDRCLSLALALAEKPAKAKCSSDQQQ